MGFGRSNGTRSRWPDRSVARIDSHLDSDAPAIPIPLNCSKFWPLAMKINAPMNSATLNTTATTDNRHADRPARVQAIADIQQRRRGERQVVQPQRHQRDRQPRIQSRGCPAGVSIAEDRAGVGDDEARRHEHRHADRIEDQRRSFQRAEEQLRGHRQHVPDAHRREHDAGEEIHRRHHEASRGQARAALSGHQHRDRHQRGGHGHRQPFVLTDDHGRKLIDHYRLGIQTSRCSDSPPGTATRSPTGSLAHPTTRRGSIRRTRHGRRVPSPARGRRPPPGCAGRHCPSSRRRTRRSARYRESGLNAIASPNSRSSVLARPPSMRMRPISGPPMRVSL